MLRVFLIADPHYFSPQIYEPDSRAYLLREQGDQICLKESPAIIDAAFDFMAQCGDTDIILIPGDLINCGEKSAIWNSSSAFRHCAGPEKGLCDDGYP